MILELSIWTHHLNQLIYSYFHFCKTEKIEVKIIRNESVLHNGAILHVSGKTAFFDYSDDPKFIDTPELYNFYFKRSLRIENYKNNVRPLNFNIPMAYKSHLLLMNLQSDFLFDKRNRTEVIRAIDKFSWFTNSSHAVLDVKRYPKKVSDFGGNIIFHTRLWNPDNHNDDEEKERRRSQNDFRINACRILKKTYKNASVGLSADNLSEKLAPDLVLDSKHSNKNKYFNMLRNYNICVADDGLKDTPGWKIGEYLLFGKAVITTPLNIAVDNFNEHINYEKLSSRNAYLELPEKIEYLLEDKKYLKMGESNLVWSENYLHPQNYIKRILSIVENNI
ncbi:hypothetical protein [Flavobacterium johnsoniae]|uniref:Glycosyltransferase family 1 protein n=1 Tax=Flavobacterium johnsoniae TaxID=986 RepID=A0A1M5L0F8_FLAJO|nr:hypothetical protein [Flavobacterium johnsoniae]SHG58445.1 hypothetical protein SAMN05444388_103282 [Flavobacterium johnsoniae]